MAKNKRPQSAMGTFGSIVIALGLALGSIMSNVYVAASGIALGIFILLIACVVDRLDIIIDLLLQIGNKEEKEPSSENKE